MDVRMGLAPVVVDGSGTVRPHSFFLQVGGGGGGKGRRNREGILFLVGLAKQPTLVR